jgi:hypothetical protein
LRIWLPRRLRDHEFIVEKEICTAPRAEPASAIVENQGAAA